MVSKLLRQHFKTWQIMSNCCFCSCFLSSTKLKPSIQTLQTSVIPTKWISSKNNAPISYISARNASTTATHEPIVFYRWPTMRHFRLISRIKLYQTSTMLLLLPPIAWWYSTDVITGHTLCYATLAATATTGVLSVLSYYFTKVAGEMTLVGGDVLRLSTLTFMGGRQEYQYPVSSIVPFADTNVDGAIQRLEVNGENTYFLYSIRYGQILNHNIFEKLLGIDTK